GETERSVFADSSVGAIAEDPTIDGYAGNIVRSQAVDDAFIQGLAIPLVVFADIDAHDFGFALALQGGYSRRGVLLRFLGRLDDSGVLHLNQSSAHHGVKLGQELLDFFRGFNELDFHGEVGRQVDQTIAVQVVIGAKSGDAARHRRSGHAVEKEKVENRGIGRAPVILMVLGYVDADFLTRSRFEHIVLLKLELVSRRRNSERS